MTEGRSDLGSVVVSPRVARMAALYAVLLLLGMMFVGRLILHTPIVPELIADRLFALFPISLIERGVQALGIHAKKLGFLGSVFIFIAIGVYGGAWLIRWLGDLSERPIQFAVFLYAVVFWYVGLSLAIPGFATGIFTGISFQMGVSAMVLLVMYLVHAIFFGPLVALLSRGAAEPGGTFLFGRRAVLASLGAVGLGSLAYTFMGKFSTEIRRGDPGRVERGNGVFPQLEGLAMEVTPTSDFYHVSKNIVDPDLDAHDWSLGIGGLVDHPMQLTYAEIVAMESVEQYATLMCISNPVGGDLIGNALWRGIRLRTLLQKAGFHSPVQDVVIWAADGYSDSIPLDRALQDGTLLCYEMNGAPLTAIHGFPVRLLVPGIYGMKNVKWITKIELVNHDYKGYWQKRGWDDRAEYKTMSRIDLPHKQEALAAVTIAGIAFAGDRGVSKVEVSTDDGASWERAEMRESLSPYAWVLWHHSWVPTRAGTYHLQARATDGRGEIQTSSHAEPIPDGASGYHRRAVRIR